MNRTASLALPLVALLAACGPTEGGFGANTSALTNGTPEAVGVLTFVNHTSTTFEVLDLDVGLDRRAARNLIDARETDGRFRSLDEVDAVRWVGPSALEKLVTYADRFGWVPAGNELLGTWDGVAFSVNESVATLLLVNTADAAVLDDDVALDSRAVNSILAARPIASVEALSALYYVGQSALLALRDFRTTPDTTTDTTDTSAELLPDGMTCTAHEACASGLCAGLTIDMGFCQPTWMEGVYTHDEAIEMADVETLETAVNIYDQASVPMDVILTLDIDHPRKEELVVELFQPGGGYQLVWNREANPPSELNCKSIERDNAINGTWRLVVTDTVTGQSGTLMGWSLYVTSRYD